MATIDTGSPYYIRYPDPVYNPAAPNYNYPSEIEMMVTDIANRLLRPARYHESASSGTISTTEIQILTEFNFTIAPHSWPNPPTGYSFYADVVLTTVVASIEASLTNVCGYVRAEAWDEVTGLFYSASPEAWFGALFQSQVNLSMPVRILPSNDTSHNLYNLKFFSKARSAGQRHKFFEARLNATQLIPFKLEVSRFFYAPEI